MQPPGRRGGGVRGRGRAEERCGGWRGGAHLVVWGPAAEERTADRHGDPLTLPLRADLPLRPTTTSRPDSENPARSGFRTVIGTSREQNLGLQGRSHSPALFSPRRTGTQKFAIVGNVARLDAARSRGAGPAARGSWERLAGSVLLWSFKGA